MCDTCGCSDTNSVRITRPGDHPTGHGDSIEENNSHAHDHHHLREHDHGHHHHDREDHHHHHLHKHDHEYDPEHDRKPEQSNSRTIEIKEDALSQNTLRAHRNRELLKKRGIFALNLVSSPGSGKTSLLEKTIHDLKDRWPLFVIEGDQQSMNDANRIDAAGAPVIQINTGSGCHLDAAMVSNAIGQLQPENNSLLFIENVGNLVCPALFDLGESRRIVIISVTEGDDKPLKYPGMFSSADLCIINKTDLLPYVSFDMDRAREYARRARPGIEFIETSVSAGTGIDKWYDWLENNKPDQPGNR